ncbi:MAG TPA: hypothetical protein VKU41_02615 [Polyangiaceae bacterium]|nr:hypothetical protein [Polyangiaceae bacterium]
MDVLFGKMSRIGLRVGPLLAGAKGPLRWAAAGALAGGLPAVWMWGFTVDDALIAVRYARHVAAGVGWRFNAEGPSTDGVTPLPWPCVLAPLAHADPMAVLARAQGLGLVVWVLAGAALGVGVSRTRPAPAWTRAVPLLALSLCVPVAAYAVSGMETAVPTALATCATLMPRRPALAAVLAGLASAFRPEMAAWACAMGLGLAWVSVRTLERSESSDGAPERVRTLERSESSDGAPRLLLGPLLAVAPFAACALVRASVWGRPAPLALMAKPSDVEHGLAYAVAACVVTLVPLIAFSPGALRREPVALAIVASAAVHVGAIVAVGGDWMPYARLMVPVVPSLAYATAICASIANRMAYGARAGFALILGCLLIARGGTLGRRVGQDRADLIARARPWLSGARRVAALDIGWVGAATEADVFDLAGLTDPEVAALPGGHTSKRVDPMFFLSRDPDAALFYAPVGLPGGDLSRWQEATYPRVVEARLAHDPVIARHYEPAAWLPLGGAGAGYVLLRKR